MIPNKKNHSKHQEVKLITEEAEDIMADRLAHIFLEQIKQDKEKDSN